MTIRHQAAQNSVDFPHFIGGLWFLLSYQMHSRVDLIYPRDLFRWRRLLFTSPSLRVFFQGNILHFLNFCPFIAWFWPTHSSISLLPK